MADPTPDQSRRPDRGERTSQGDADEYHGRGAETISRLVQSSRLPRDGRIDGPAWVDVAADAATATTAGDAYATDECCPCAVDGDAVCAALVWMRDLETPRLVWIWFARYV